MSRLKIGIIGCGAIGQIQYLPLLRELHEFYEISAISDLSASMMAKLGIDYGIPVERQFTDYRALVDSDVDCVVVCNTTAYHAPTSIDAARAGKHILIEKPMCTTIAEAEAIAEACEQSRVVAMVGYMKQHDPAYISARSHVSAMADIRFVQVNHLHPDNSLHLKRFFLYTPDDIPESVRETMVVIEREQTAEALGVHAYQLKPDAHRAFFYVLNSMIHDIGNLSGMFGPPSRILSAEFWEGGNCITTTLEYDSGFRAIASWVDLPDLQTFDETFEVYGSRQRVIVSFPTGFSVGLPTELTLHGMDDNEKPYIKHQSWQENPFKLELLKFHECITTGAPVLTPVRNAVADIRLVGQIVRTAMQQQGARNAN